MKTLLIDNYDSFTFNLYQLIAEVNGEEPIVVRHDELTWRELRDFTFHNVVISPGPGRPERPEDFGVCSDVIRECRQPLLGVCLGHQGIATVHGGRVIHAPEVMHGRLSLILHDGSTLFAGLPQRFLAVRYHSLLVDHRLPPHLRRVAWTADGLTMALHHTGRDQWGIQFHPESICTEFGRALLTNFRDLTHAGRRSSVRSKQPPAVPAPPSLPASLPAIPLLVRSRRLDTLIDPERAFVTLFGSAASAFWLDSSRIEATPSRFSYIGSADGPRSFVVRYRCRDRRLRITRRGMEWTARESLFSFLDRTLNEHRCASDALPFDFNGGFVGYFGYELKAELGAGNVHQSACPDAAFIFADRTIVFDHEEGATFVLALAEAGDEAAADCWVDETAARLMGLSPEPLQPPPVLPGPVSFRLARDRRTYLEDIRCCQQLLRDGESYEICLTNTVHIDARLDALSQYRWLRRVNPAPFAAFLRFSDMAVLCSSPERFLSLDRKGYVEARPIKGTRPRGRTQAEDEALCHELRTSTKERAENLMIVDLLRNDLGRICEVGTVHVPRLMTVESYRTVHQLVSTIRGHLRSDRAALDCVRAAFPGGSMTGAPKLRTMSILDRLETRARGVYSGALGFLAVNRTMDLNIVIRTIVIGPHETTVGAGGAIVALSDPEAEFEEMLLKAAAPLHAILQHTKEGWDEDRVAIASALQQNRWGSA